MRTEEILFKINELIKELMDFVVLDNYNIYSQKDVNYIETLLKKIKELRKQLP